MKLLCTILTLALLTGAYAQTNSVPLPPDPDPPPMPPTTRTIGEPYVITADGETNAVLSYPFLLATGVDTNGRVVMEAPPEWMLKRVQPEPYYEVEAWDDLNDRPIVIRIYSQKSEGYFRGGLKTGDQGAR